MHLALRMEGLTCKEMSRLKLVAVALLVLVFNTTPKRLKKRAHSTHRIHAVTLSLVCENVASKSPLGTLQTNLVQPLVGAIVLRVAVRISAHKG